MKYILLTATFLAANFLVACAPSTAIAQRTSNNTAIAPVPKPITPAQTSAAEEAQVRAFVENFGKRLQSVSLLAPDAVQEIQEQYSAFVSPALLDTWRSDISRAPGRSVSSPWPDRIDITSLSKDDSGGYVLTGFIIEVTSVEVVNGGAAARIPVHIVVQKSQGSWLITEYTEEQ